MDEQANHKQNVKLQAIIYFVLAKIEGKTRLEAIQAFCDGELCRTMFNDRLTVGMVYGLAQAGGYSD